MFGLGMGLGASACSVCSWHSLTPYHDPSQAMAVALWTCSRQMASLGCASLPLLGVPGTWSSLPDPQKVPKGLFCTRYPCLQGHGGGRWGLLCQEAEAGPGIWGVWAGGKPGLQQPLCQFLISI